MFNLHDVLPRTCTVVSRCVKPFLLFSHCHLSRAVGTPFLACFFLESATDLFSVARFAKVIVLVVFGALACLLFCLAAPRLAACGVACRQNNHAGTFPAWGGAQSSPSHPRALVFAGWDGEETPSQCDFFAALSNYY